MGEIISVSDEEMNALTSAILKRHGIDFTCYEPKSLKRRIVRAISVLGFPNIHEMWIRILREPKFIHSFMNEISVGLTSMFRDPVLWTTLRNQHSKFLPAKEMRIWHAGCSTGEEVFTMGVLLHELALLENARAVATDISLDAIQIARRGEYHKIKVLEFERNYLEYNSRGNLERYYSRSEHTACFNTDLIKHVDFKYHNLITDRPEGKFDIIFCRNVMIYFDNAAKISLMERFHRALNPGGLLIIGFYDALLPLLNEKIFEVADLDAKIFRSL